MMHDSKLDPNRATTPRTGVYNRSRRSSWGIGGVIVALLLIGLFAWGWDREEPVATGAVAPLATTVPPAVPVVPARP